MNLMSHLNELLINTQVMDVNISHLLDLTLLEDKVDKSALYQLQTDGSANDVAALCIFPEYLEFFNECNLTLATVVNFPAGSLEIDSVLQTIDKAVYYKAQEIDYVFPYIYYLNNEKTLAINACRTIVEYCHTKDVIIKVILETGAFENLDNIYQASIDVINTDCDFIKTSTGKISQGASLSAAFAMLSAIKDMQSTCGIKFSGGIRTRTQANSYLNLITTMFDKPITKNWVRFGVSRLLKD